MDVHGPFNGFDAPYFSYTNDDNKNYPNEQPSQFPPINSIHSNFPPLHAQPQNAAPYASRPTPNLPTEAPWQAQQQHQLYNNPPFQNQFQNTNPSSIAPPSNQFPSHLPNGAVPQQQGFSLPGQVPPNVPSAYPAQSHAESLTSYPNQNFPNSLPQMYGMSQQIQQTPPVAQYNQMPMQDPKQMNQFPSSHIQPSALPTCLPFPPSPLAFYEPPSFLRQSQPFLEKLCHSTLNILPNTPTLLSKMKIPFGLTLTPYTCDAEDAKIPIVASQIIRCRKCRAYINPFVEWLEQGARYKCNLCFYVNDIPSDYDYDPASQKYLSRSSRLELSNAVVEFMAPTEYMVRAPQPNVFFFILDVSYTAVSNGSVAVLSRILLSCLDSLPNKDGRTKIGFCLMDDHLTFVYFNITLKEPQLLSVPRDPDTKDAYLPRPDDLLVNLSDCRFLIEAFLAKLPSLFLKTQVPQPAVGIALSTIYKLLGSIGGKIICFLSSLPGLDQAELKARDEASLLGTDKESTLFLPINKFYKDLSVDFSKDQLSVDFVLTPAFYIDYASILPLSRYTCGKIFYYAGFKSTCEADVVQLSSELSTYLAQNVGWEAVLRIRASKGISVTSYHGNFFIRQTDLLNLANVNPSFAYSVEMTLDEPLAYSTAFVQAALLHTTCMGERRIRVITLPLRVSPSLNDCYFGIDAMTLVHCLSKSAIELLSNGAKFDTVRDFVYNKGLDVLSSLKTNLYPQVSSSQILITENMNPFPQLLLGLLKSLSLRSVPRVPADLRNHYHALLRVMSVPDSCLQFYPTLYPLHQLPSFSVDPFYFPVPLNLSSERFDRQGIYLMDTGTALYLWMGSAASSILCQSLLAQSHVHQMAAGKTVLPELDTPFSKYVHTLLKKLYSNEEKGHRWMSPSPVVYLVKEDPGPNEVFFKNLFLSFLIEDRFETMPSYAQFLAQLRDKINAVLPN